MATRRATVDRAAADLTFEELYRGYRADVYRAALRDLGDTHEAEEVTQAAFVDAYRAVLRGTEPESPRAWLLAISENVRRRRFRTAQRRPREVPLDADFPTAAEISHEQAWSLAEALAELPDEQRRVFVLRELRDLSYEEIADEVGSTVASVQMLLFRARRSLRERLDPPVVARRRPGIVVPVPGWLTGLASRVEIATLTPRVAGAVGATVLAVAGAGVAVSGAPADQAPTVEAAHQPAVAAVAPASRVTAQPSLVATRHTAVAPASTTRATARRPPTVPTATPPPPPASAAPVSEVPAPTAAPGPAAPTAEPGVSSPALVPALQPVLDPAVPAVGGIVGTVLEPLPAAEPVAPVVEPATGAAGAAGAGIPPLPVPALPPGALPPLP
jgi:RNA polymerase sigma-70 factor (ECF subfamily)